MCGHAVRPDGGHTAVQELFPGRESGECLDLLCGLSGPDVLAIGLGGLLPACGRAGSDFKGGAVPGGVGRHFHRRFCPASSSSLSFDRLAVVSDHAGAGHWDSAGGGSGAGGSLQLSVADRLVCSVELGGGGTMRRLASPPRGAGPGLHHNPHGLDSLCAHAGFLLAEQRGPLDSRARLHD